MKTINLDWKQLIQDISDVVKNVEGAGLPSEIDAVLSQYDEYLATTPIPSTIANWLDKLIDLMNNVEGAELERELKSIKPPKVAK
jgi:hypothetical protein